VAGALGGDLHAVGAGERDDLDHVLDVGGQGDEGRLLDDGEVEGLRCRVPAVPARLDHVPPQAGAQRAQGRNRGDTRRLEWNCLAHDSSFPDFSLTCSESRPAAAARESRQQAS
jgi:hypothetical protein